MQPEYNLALGRCHLQLGHIDEAVTYLGNVVRVRPKNATGWIELLNCLYQGELFEEGLDYAAFAFEQTDGKPIFIYFKSAFLFAIGKPKEALLYLETALKASPRLLKQFIEINPALLQQQQVVELLARHKKGKAKK
jgi:tetratricopeptide (TPR) repeat protein